MLVDVPEWLPRAPPMSPEEVELFGEPSTAVFVAVVVSFWFAWQFMEEMSGWMFGS